MRGSDMRGAFLALALVLGVIALAGRGAAAADADADEQAKLRDALRNAITQVRSLEDEQAALQAKAAEAEKQNQLLRQQVDDLTKKLGDQGAGAIKKAEFDKAVAEMNGKLALQNDTIAKLNVTLEKWKAAYNEAASLAQKKEGDRAKLAAEDDVLTRRATTCEEKNARLFAVGNEILARLEKIGLGDVMGRLEPFVGIKRVELQNLAQDYQDKLLDQKATP